MSLLFSGQALNKYKKREVGEPLADESSGRRGEDLPQSPKADGARDGVTNSSHASSNGASVLNHAATRGMSAADYIVGPPSDTAGIAAATVPPPPRSPVGDSAGDGDDDDADAEFDAEAFAERELVTSGSAHALIRLGTASPSRLADTSDSDSASDDGGEGRLARNEEVSLAPGDAAALAAPPAAFHRPKERTGLILLGGGASANAASCEDCSDDAFPGNHAGDIDREVGSSADTSNSDNVPPPLVPTTRVPMPNILPPTDESVHVACDAREPESQPELPEAATAAPALVLDDLVDGDAASDIESEWEEEEEQAERTLHAVTTDSTAVALAPPEESGATVAALPAVAMAPPSTTAQPASHPVVPTAVSAEVRPVKEAPLSSWEVPSPVTVDGNDVIGEAWSPKAVSPSDQVSVPVHPSGGSQSATATESALLPSAQYAVVESRSDSDSSSAALPTTGSHVKAALAIVSPAPQPPSNSNYERSSSDEFSEISRHDDSGAQHNASSHQVQPLDLNTPTMFLPVQASEFKPRGSQKQLGLDAPAAPPRMHPPPSPPIAFVEAVRTLIRDPETWRVYQEKVGSKPPVKRPKWSILGLCSSSSSTSGTVVGRASSAPALGSQEPTAIVDDNGHAFVIALQHLPLNHSNTAHRRILLTVCRELLKLDPREADPPTRNARCWEQLGFQGADPATDLRSTGMLGPLLVLFLLDRYPGVAAELWGVANATPTAELPFVLMCFNLTAIVSELHRAGRLSKYAAAIPKESARQMSEERNLSVLLVVSYCFTGVVRVFLERWAKLPGTPTVREFGGVKEDVKQYVAKHLADTLKRARVTA